MWNIFTIDFAFVFETNIKKSATRLNKMLKIEHLPSTMGLISLSKAVVINQIPFFCVFDGIPLLKEKLRPEEAMQSTF